MIQYDTMYTFFTSQISKKAGVFVNTKGRYLTSEQRLVVDTTRDRPLYLYIQAETEANVQRE